MPPPLDPTALVGAPKADSIDSLPYLIIGGPYGNTTKRG
jgi:hypothetical protein